MPYQHFQIPCSGGEVQAELNRFLHERRVLKVEKQFVAAGLDSFWAYQIHYETGATPAAGGLSDSGKKGLIDYKMVLTDVEFSRFLTLKDWRKERSQKDGVEAFTIFTNAQLADISKRQCETLAALKEISGVGDARVEKYGTDVLALLRQTKSPADT